MFHRRKLYIVHLNLVNKRTFILHINIKQKYNKNGFLSIKREIINVIILNMKWKNHILFYVLYI